MKELDFRKLKSVDSQSAQEIVYREYRELRMKKDSPKEEPTEKEGLLELQFYSNKIKKPDWQNFFRVLLRRHTPLFDFIDFSKTIPLRSINLIIKKKANTIRIYLNEPGIEGADLSSLIFPFKLKERKSLPIHSGLPKGLNILKNSELFDFMVKGNLEEINLRIFPFFGKFPAIGTTTNSNYSRSAIFLTDSTKFLEIDLEKNPSFYMELIDKPLLKSIYMDAYDPIFESKGVRIGIDSYDAFKHSLIIGMSGCGKSKFLYILSKALKQKYGARARIVLIDPHGEFAKIYKNNEANIIDFKSKYIEPLEIGQKASPMTTQLIQDLIMSIIGEKNKYADRVLFYTIYLLSEIGELNLQNVSKLLTDSAKRMEQVSKVTNEEVKRFFSTEFDDIYINHFNDAVLPILNFIGEYELYMGNKSSPTSLVDSIEDNGITVLSFDPHFFGRKMIKFLAGAVIQQMYVLAVTNKFKDPVVFIVDEFPIVETSVCKNILAETRKFNLHLYLSMQYLNQLREDIIQSILTNMYNYIIFKCNRQDASIISQMMDIKVEEYFKKQRQPSELEEEKKDLFINLMPRECVVRLFDGTRHMMPVKVFVSDMKNWESPQVYQVEETVKPNPFVSKYKEDNYSLLGSGADG